MKQTEFNNLNIQVEKIKSLTAAAYHVTTEAVTIRRRKRVIVTPRQVGILLTYKLTNLTLKETSRIWGLSGNHSTVIYSIRKIEGYYYTCRSFRSDVDKIIHALGLSIDEGRLRLQLSTKN